MPASEEIQSAAAALAKAAASAPETPPAEQNQETATTVTASSGSSSSGAEVNTGRWTVKEHLRFLDALRVHGQDWRRIAVHMKTRNNIQVRTHAQKYFKKLERQQRRANELAEATGRSGAKRSRQGDHLRSSKRVRDENEDVEHDEDELRTTECTESENDDASENGEEVNNNEQTPGIAHGLATMPYLPFQAMAFKVPLQFPQTAHAGMPMPAMMHSMSAQPVRLFPVPQANMMTSAPTVFAPRIGTASTWPMPAMQVQPLFQQQLSLTAFQPMYVAQNGRMPVMGAAPQQTTTSTFVAPNQLSTPSRISSI